MPKREIYDDELYAHFLTFSCYHRRRLLDPDVCKRVVLGVLNTCLSKQSARCVGFVLMPDHVHAVVWFPECGQLSLFMKQWKQQSSVRAKRALRESCPAYAGEINPADPFWQRKYYDFNLYSDKKLREKVEYMHLNPVRAGLVDDPCQWPWSSARYYEQGQSVGVPVEWVD